MRALLIVVALSSAASAERLHAPSGEIVDVPDASVEFALRDGYKRLGTVMFRDSAGTVHRVYDEPIAIAMAQERGWWRMTSAEVGAELVKEDEARKARYDEMKKDLDATPTHIKVFIGVIVLVGIFVAFALFRDFVWKKRKVEK